MLGGQEQGKQAALPVEERKGCAFSNVAKEGPNGRCSKDLTSQFKPRLLGNVVREGSNGRCSKNLTSQFKPRRLGGKRAKG
jgi:hypothetical protein